MKQEPSAEACSALIEYWAKEYERLYGSSDSELPSGAQIPPNEMKQYIDNYKKWYETPSDKNEAKTKLSILRRIAESWQLNVDTINKLIKYIESTLAMLVIMFMCGCQSGMYQIDAEKCSVNDGARLTYRIVDKLAPESYSEEYLPVEVNTTKVSGSDNSEGLCILTLGIIPAFYDYFETINVTVKTPIGTKTGSGSVHAKKWVGWLCMIPYPGSAEERSERPELPNSVLEKKVKDQIVESLVAQFSPNEYASFVQKVKEQKSREQQRIQQKKQMLDSLVKEGRFEDVIKACSAEKVELGKENPWAEIRERAFTELRKSVPTMTDSGRLISLFSLLDDITLKDAIVIRLGKLGKCSELGDASLVKYIAESSSEEGRLCAVAAISLKDKLVVVAKSKYSKTISIAAFKKLHADEIRDDIFTGNQFDEELAEWYIDAHGTDQELITIIKSGYVRLGSKIEKMLKTRKISDEVREELNKQEMREKASKFDSYDVSLHLFENPYISEIESVSDPSARTSLAECLLDRHMGNCGRFNVSLWTDAETISKFTNFLSEKYSERLWSKLEMLWSGRKFSGREDQFKSVFAIGLIKKMGEKARQDRILSALNRFKASTRIHFEGFYIGMTWGDFCAICAQKGCVPDVQTGKTGVDRIVFSRTERYAMFKKEDGEFWAAYLRKYVPSQKKQKSFTETIGDVLDSGTFDYQEGWDDNLDERCYIYKSMKYGTRVLFGQKTGKLVLEEYK